MTAFDLDNTLPDLKGQFRLDCIQLYNWGTFRRLHSIPISREGHLIVGPSGCGKSTILDAKTALLAPTQWLDFNAAAREGGKRERDRNLVTYIRGAWSNQEGDEGGTVLEVLDKGSTWSALGMTLSALDGRCVTLVQVFWIRGSGMDSKDVQRHYLVLDRSYDLKELEFFGKEDFNIRKLKQTVKSAYSGDIAAGYRECFQSRLGIPSEQALKLLHKAQSTKNIGDLNAFMRDLMLERPGTFDVARKLVEEFTNLNEAYLAVQKARQQIELLGPARQHAHERAAAQAQAHKLRELNVGIQHYVAKRREGLLEEAVASGLENEARLGRTIAVAERLAIEADTLLDDLRRALWQAGGEAIERMTEELKSLEAQKADRACKRANAAEALKQLQLEFPSDEESFVHLVTEARARSESLGADFGAVDAARVELLDRKGNLERELAVVEAEVTALAARRSNIPDALQQLRRMVAHGAGCSEDDLPFAGELLEVRKDEQPWRGAIERLLGKFSTSMLVPDHLYPQVRRFVNDTHLNQNLTYHLAGNANQARARESNSVRAAFRKLEIADSPFRDWIEAELRSRFNHECVDTPDEMSRFEFALTRQGQIRGGRSVHEKRDRYRVDDAHNWSLGWDNSEKRRLYENRRGGLKNQVAETTHQLNVLQDGMRDKIRTIKNTEAVANLVWSDIDTEACDRHKADVQKELARLRSGSTDLPALEKRVAAQKEVSRHRNEDLGRERAERQTALNRRNEWQKRLDDLRNDPSRVEPTPTQAAGLDQRFAATGRVVTLESLGDVNARVQRALGEDIQAAAERAIELRGKIESAFTEFKTRWPAEAGDMDTSTESGDAYFALLETLERDRLPAYESRFRDMLQTQSDQYLATLQRKLSDEAREIEAKIDSVNEALRHAPFGKGTFLEIESKQIHQQDVMRFKTQLKEVLSQSFLADAAASEQRFMLMKALVERLGSTKAEDERWRSTVLDVRQHVEFMAREKNEDGATVEVYRSGAGKSGGQRQKLTTTCLAAALRFQLVGEGDEVPQFAPVAMDEAFDKADHEFTTMALGIFQRFGFQIIVATPMKAVTTFEPFIGGATMVSIRDKKNSSARSLTVRELMTVARA